MTASSTKKTGISERDRRAFIKAIVPNLINVLHADGIVSDEDLLDADKVHKKIRDLLDQKKLNFVIVNDHRDTIINLAKQQQRLGRHELAFTLYATFVEHTINKIIQLECSRKKIDSKTIIDIIKNVNIVGKCTWLFTLLGLKPLKADHLSIIFSIADERNAFIHYKWKPDPYDTIPEMEKRDKEVEAKLERLKKALRYLRAYETQHEYKGKKKKISKVVF